MCQNNRIFDVQILYAKEWTRFYQVLTFFDDIVIILIIMCCITLYYDTAIIIVTIVIMRCLVM